MTTFRSDKTVAGRRWLRRVFGVIIVLIAMAGALVLRARSFDATLPPALDKSTTIAITLPDGRPARIGSLLKPDRPTIINLWASWCVPCRREAPVIAELHRRFGNRINLLYLNVRDENATRADLDRSLAEIGLPADAYARLAVQDIGMLTGSGDVLIPRTLVFDRQGAPLASITGYRPLALARVAALLSQGS